MKIILPVHHFPPRYSAGAELYTFRLARWLQAHGHDIEVVCVESIEQGRAGELRVEADHYQGVAVQRLIFNLIGAHDRLRWNYDNPLLERWFADYFRRVTPDIVHFQAGYLIGAAPLVVAHAAGIPIALTLHDYWYLCPRLTLQRGDGSLCETIPEQAADCAWCMRLVQRRYRIANQISGGLARKVTQLIALHDERDAIAARRARLLPILSLPDAVIAPSSFLATRFAPFVPPDRLHISRYGLDHTRFRPPSERGHNAALRIGFIGQIAPHKGIHLLIEAFRSLQKRERAIELHIYGGLEAQAHYVARLRGLAGHDDRIHFQGRFENSQVATILAELDVVVVPSVWYENSPLAIMEAQAAGTPVVTAALGGMAELVHDNVDGLHFRPADAADLAQQLQRLIDNPDLLATLRSGIRMPRGIDDEMLQLMEIYRHVVSAPPIALDSMTSEPSASYS